MRFEELIGNVVVRYPELRVYDSRPGHSRATRNRVSDGVALGRRLHGRFWREAATTVFWKPVKATVESIAREWNRRSTIKALRSLEDHRLEDIGIERSDIRSVARALAYGTAEGETNIATRAVATETVETFDIAKAA